MDNEEIKEIPFPEGISSNKGTFKLCSESSYGVSKKYKKLITCEDNSYVFFCIQKELVILEHEIEKIDIKSYDTVVKYAEMMFPEGNEISWSMDILQFWNDLEYLQDDLSEMKSDGMDSCCSSIVDILDDLLTMQFALKPYINYYLSHEVNTKDGFKIEVGDTVFFSLVKSLPPFGDGRPNIRRGVVDRIMSHYAVGVRLECPYVLVFDKIYHVKNNLILDEIKVWRAGIKELRDEIGLKYEIIEALEGQICPEN